MTSWEILIQRAKCFIKLKELNMALEDFNQILDNNDVPTDFIRQVEIDKLSLLSLKNAANATK
jgi:hypothetical protein